MGTFYQKSSDNKCARCGRKSKYPEKFINGMGKACAKKFEDELNQQQKDKVHVVTGNAMQGDDIVMYRGLNNGLPMVNLVQKKVLHSPTGFEFGYSGSGPADLALNILLLYLPEKEAITLHQDFKHKFIATVDRAGGVIKAKDIQQYIDTHAKTLFD